MAEKWRLTAYDRTFSANIEHLWFPRFGARFVNWDDEDAQYPMPYDTDAIAYVECIDPEPSAKVLAVLLEELHTFTMDLSEHQAKELRAERLKRHGLEVQ
jgi:hypothetical protein